MQQYSRARRMPIFFDADDLTDEQRSRYDWAVQEYRRIQCENQARSEASTVAAMQHSIGPQSALFARLLDGQPALPYPPPTSNDYPWYDIVEKPGQYQVSITAPWTSIPGKQHDNRDDGARIVLNQCSWTVVRANESGSVFLDFLKLVRDPRQVPEHARLSLLAALARQPEIFVTFGQWGEFRLFLGRIIRRGKRQVAVNSRFDIVTLDGGNPEIVKVLQQGAALRAKSDATLAMIARNRQDKAETPLSALEQITLTSESAIAFSEDPQEDDLVEFDCDGWVLERILST